LRGRLWRPGVARPTHMVRSRLVYITNKNISFPIKTYHFQ
jgi:hypothetical protein